MKRVICLLVVLLGLGGVAISQNVKKKVAVYVTGDVESGYKKVIGSKMVSGITKSESYIAVERTTDFLSALSKEQDYQTSGAVNDNQIVRLGQQFGVRFVVVADVSEVFESIFISARMIDVQTGQITGSAEGSKAVDNMEGLTALSMNVVSELLGGVAYSSYVEENNISDIKIVGPISSIKQMYDYCTTVPEGYHIASKDEIEKLIKSYKEANKTVVFPIYAEIEASFIDCFDDKHYYCMGYQIDKTFSFSNISRRDTYCCSRKEWRRSDITVGYIYLIKNK